MEKETNSAENVSFSMMENEEHAIALESLCSILETDLYYGLTCKQAKNRLKIEGYNQYSRPKKISSPSNSPSLLKKIFKQSLPKDIWSKKDWDRVINNRADQELIVVRDRTRCIVRVKDLVRGDIVFLENGQIVPADMRVITCEGEVLVDNRIITGNSCEIKSNKYTDEDFLLSENILFANTEILSGKCVGIVLKTGDKTVFGELTRFAQKVRYTQRSSNTSSTCSSSRSMQSLSSSCASSINISEAGSLDSQMEMSI